LGYSTDAHEFLPSMIEFFDSLGDAHLPTAALGFSLLALLLAIQRLMPSLPVPLIVVACGIGAVAMLDLGEHGVALAGAVPAGLPAPAWTWFDLPTYRSLLGDAAGILLISFTSGILTAKSFARRNRYGVDADQELLALGAANLAAGLGQGFAVTGADSRTAVNDAMGGRTQLVGVVAAGAMLVVLLFLTEPLALVPTAALAAVIVVSALGLFDVRGLLELAAMSRREGMLALATTIGVLVLGVLPGVVVAVVLSLFWLIAIAMRPGDAILGELPELGGFHSLADYPEARTRPGLLLYRFNANVVFFNADYFCACLCAAIHATPAPVRWVVVDLSPVSFVDATALQRFDQLREELAGQGISLAVAHAKRQLGRAFERRWLAQRRGRTRSFPTLRAAVRAFEDASGPER
jgi:MFS superfamily sulfate permease-like transporter